MGNSQNSWKFCTKKGVNSQNSWNKFTKKRAKFPKFTEFRRFTEFTEFTKLTKFGFSVRPTVVTVAPLSTTLSFLPFLRYRNSTPLSLHPIIPPLLFHPIHAIHFSRRADFLPLPNTPLVVSLSHASHLRFACTSLGIWQSRGPRADTGWTSRNCDQTETVTLQQRRNNVS